MCICYERKRKIKIGTATILVDHEKQLLSLFYYSDAASINEGSVPMFMCSCAEFKRVPRLNDRL
jgi:hypothetical protein